VVAAAEWLCKETHNECKETRKAVAHG
jgi:hypothetical protein